MRASSPEVAARLRAAGIATTHAFVERFFGGFIPWQYRDIRLSRATDYDDLNGYRAAARRDAR